MPVALDQVQEQRAVRQRRRGIVVAVIVISLLAHLGAGTVATLWIVVRYLTEPVAIFSAPPKPAIAPQFMDPKMASAEFEAATSKPTLDSKLASLRESPFALPEVPMVEVSESLKFDPSSIQGVEGMVDGFAGAGGSGEGGGGGLGASTYFGFRGGAERGLLRGYLYDLKLDKAGKPLGNDVSGGMSDSGGNASKYTAIAKEFINRGWKMSVLDDYYRCEKPLFLNHLYIPLMDASEAPKSFEAPPEVNPSVLIAIYEGEVIPPAGKRFRFVGYADDLLVVRWGNNVVLDGGRRGTRPTSRGEDLPKNGPPAANGSLCFGEWINPSSVPTHIQILMGERPGGKFAAFLMVEFKDETYAQDSRGTPILPLFKLFEATVPAVKNANEGPQILPDHRLFTPRASSALSL
jgi:hypothetical protein